MLIAVLAAACGDEVESPPPGTSFEERLAGDYRLRSDDGGGYVSWFRFFASGRYVQLIARDIGLHEIHGFAWVVEDAERGRILIGAGGFQATFGPGDSVLTLVSDHENDTFVCTRAAGAPDTAGWVSGIEVLEELEAPDPNPTDLAWDGTGLWYPNGVTAGPLRRMNPDRNLQVDRTLPVDHNGMAVAVDGADFWIDDGLESRLYKVDGATGATLLASLSFAPAEIRGISVAPDGRVWVSAGLVRAIDAAAGAATDSVDLVHSPDGLEHVGAALYAALGTPGIARVEGPPWRVTATYKLPLFSIRGLAFDGADWWLDAIDYRGNVTTRILRARLAGR